MFSSRFTGLTTSQRQSGGSCNASCSPENTELITVLNANDALGLSLFSPPQLEVLHLLSPAQKAELLLRPEVAGLDNGTLSLVFHSLLTGGSGPPPTMSPPGGHNWTTPISIYHPHPPQHPFGEVPINVFVNS